MKPLITRKKASVEVCAQLSKAHDGINGCCEEVVQMLQNLTRAQWQWLLLDLALHQHIKNGETKTRRYPQSLWVEKIFANDTIEPATVAAAYISTLPKLAKHLARTAHNDMQCYAAQLSHQQLQRDATNGLTQLQEMITW